MGSFSMRCSLSDLPIGDGDEIIWIPLLTLTPLGQRNQGYSGEWAAWCPGIRTTYNDYGRPDPDIMSKPLKDLFVQYLQEGLLEQGTGDNSCHDVPTLYGMTFEQYQEAMWENRLSVIAEKRGAPVSQASQEHPDKWVKEYVPTIQRLTDLLGAAYHVDKLPSGVIRVRVAGYGGDKGKALEDAKTKVDATYSSIKVAGTGSYADEFELWVFAQVAKGRRNEQIYDEERHQRPTSAHLVQCMIRADVWDGFVKLPFEVDYGWGEELTLARVKERVSDAWDKYVKLEDPKYLEGLDPELRISLEMSRYDDREVLLSSLETAERYSRIRTLRGAIQCAVRYSAPEHKEEILQAFAETIYIGQKMYNYRKAWEPTSPFGPQCPEWPNDAAYTAMIDSIAQKNLKAYMDKCGYENEIDADCDEDESEGEDN